LEQFLKQIFDDLQEHIFSELSQYSYLCNCLCVMVNCSYAKVQAMKRYKQWRGIDSEGTAPRINLHIRWSNLVNFTLRALYFLGKDPDKLCMGEWVGRKSAWKRRRFKKFLPLPGSSFSSIQFINSLY